MHHMHQNQGGKKVDPSGEFPSGETYTDFAGFKNVLTTIRSELFVRNLIEKLLTYASGRHMERDDQFEIDEILQEAKLNGYALHDILVAVLTSDIFCSG